jgi:hypothetical protein
MIQLGWKYCNNIPIKFSINIPIKLAGLIKMCLNEIYGN